MNLFSHWREQKRTQKIPESDQVQPKSERMPEHCLAKWNLRLTRRPTLHKETTD